MSMEIERKYVVITWTDDTYKFLVNCFYCETIIIHLVKYSTQDYRETENWVLSHNLYVQAGIFD
jgi:hypothetical protein